MKRFLIALQFLTILPIKITKNIKPEEFGGSLYFFPVVGLLIGLTLSLLLKTICFLSPLAYSAIILIFYIILTGAMHLDGFSDMCDGFYGGKNKEDILKIMRDPHIGSMGVIGLVCILVLKFSCISSIQVEKLWKILVFAPAFSRWIQVLCCYKSEYPRENGKAKYFIEFAGLGPVVTGCIFCLCFAFLLLGIKGLGISLVVFLLSILFKGYVKNKIGGMTGDTIGACGEFSETIIFLTALF